MALHVALRHITHYRYDRAVLHGPHVVRLRPAPHCRTRILSYSQTLTGGEHFIHWQQDPFSNWNARVVFPEAMKELAVEVNLVVEMAVFNPFDFFLEESAETFPFVYEPRLREDLRPFLATTAPGPLLAAYGTAVCKDLRDHPEAHARGGFAAEGGKRPRTLDFLVALNQRVQRDIRYEIRLEAGVQSPEETLQLRSGSCRDSAWLMVMLLRQLGLAARFVSGYLIQLAPDVQGPEEAGGAKFDFTDLHAWCEVYLPGAGWVGLDATSGLLAGEGHLPLSCTPEPSTAAPVSGALGLCEAKLEHTMTVRRIAESPRVTKPYTEAQWERLDALGDSVDRELESLDVRLTMGGEPTFVSMDDPDGPEWNFTAVSPRKRVLSGQLLRRLKARFAPGALLHYGQGKWYPGEPLPRWALSAFWRKDGVPMWKDDALIADEAQDYGHGAREARELAGLIARGLGVEERFLLPGYEDVFYYTWRERRLPSNVTPENSRLRDKIERDRLAALFQKGLGEVAGYALPVRREQEGWRSGGWFLRDGETLWLMPGDSPMGLRLPIDSIPWVSETDYPWVIAKDPSVARAKLPSIEALRQRFVRTQVPDPVSGPRQREVERGAPGPGESAAWVVRTALCVEPRHGRLHVFFPPVESVEDYLELVHAVEEASDHLGFPVILEGEAPPRDARLNKLSVTPDPGVIEVNLHPSKSWRELVERTTVLYEEARGLRLAAEKFMLDGRHTGTGGGNHILIGGETVNDSPILRRPDLLRSLLVYWQHHPSLSWLFSGLFIGPTSQAPRVDEARNDSLHELEVAFRELDRRTAAASKGAGGVARTGPPPVPPWLVDRLFRNLLLDASGNTHRAEFCIDKLYAPESASGRLGLVEVRGFEMPPHARMSLAQHLLLRGLIAMFWKRPTQRGFVRWGTDIHDRWMLPHCCETDFREVLSDLAEAGHSFEFEWFAPQFEFRFPKIGEFASRDVWVELRTALEPWHVLGEEPGGGGTVRYVDSSLERLQVKARGLIGDRFVVTCNGQRVPLHPTGVPGEAVAGVRYRAWQPPGCLHPTIEVQTPLKFDLIDTWNDVSLGGCAYHTAHPGGLSHVAFPVNAYEAESRRLARFLTLGRTAGPVQAPPRISTPEHPWTLDLRCS